LSAVRIVVTIETGRVKAQECPVDIHLVSVSRQVFPDEIRLVTIAALELTVFSLEFISGVSVFEIVDTARPVDELKVPARVFAVALEAFLFVTRAHLEMIPPATIESRRDLFVALQAFLVARSLAEVVALEALPHPLQEGVGLRQLTRRYLRAWGRKSYTQTHQRPQQTASCQNIHL
jgi:hypothetical protein